MIKKERPQDRIKFLILNNNKGFSEREMALALGRLPQTFNYWLNAATTCDADLLNECYEYFNKKGLNVFRNEEKELSALKDTILDFSGLFNYEMAILTKNFQKDISDGKYDESERERALRQLADMKEELNHAINELHELIAGELPITMKQNFTDASLNFKYPDAKR